MHFPSAFHFSIIANVQVLLGHCCIVLRTSLLQDYRQYVRTIDCIDSVTFTEPIQSMVRTEQAVPVSDGYQQAPEAQGG